MIILNINNFLVIEEVRYDSCHILLARLEIFENFDIYIYIYIYMLYIDV